MTIKLDAVHKDHAEYLIIRFDNGGSNKKSRIKNKLKDHNSEKNTQPSKYKPWRIKTTIAVTNRQKVLDSVNIYYLLEVAKFGRSPLCSKYDPRQKGGPMNESTIKIRLMKADDFDAVVGIDKKVLKGKASRSEYYEMKFEKLFETKDYLPASLVAEKEDGTVVGFVMGETYMGEFGIFQDAASLDTIGVDPDYQHKGIGEQLINEFMDHLRKLGVRKVNTLVDWDDSKLLQFFRANQFTPSKTINLERIL